MERSECAARVRCAASAAWWTVLIGAAWMTLGWAAWLYIPCSQCMTSCVETMWGGVKVADVQPVVWLMVGVMKIILFVCVMIAIFLTIWGRKLRKSG